MFKLFKNLFEHRCPECNELLSIENTTLCMIKSCSQGHYKEETYSSLGVTIVYDSSKDDE
ncbi:hypothetical protein ACP8HI_19980 [Paenibacillus sp. FA6]|uniref:hypothetical protein n=1 Tax=Paenibacillus sp. FA6 TaxID=3413029 RepID=UPI003F65B9B2